MEKEIKIFLVEDNEGDIVLTKQAFKNVKIATSINVAKDGIEALSYLRKEGPFKNVETPDLVLLDINLPRKNGLKVLEEIKNDDKLRSIPVMMMTTSDSEKDIVESYYNHANCYIVKPVDFKNFMNVVQTIKDFWVSLVKLPKHDK